MSCLDKQSYLISLKFCEFILPHVSRTFALNIKVLRGSERRAILVSYLICRIVDTIEDALMVDELQKMDLLKKFIALLKDDVYHKKNICRWVDEVKNLNSSAWDKTLLINTLNVLQMYYYQSKIYRQAILPSVEEMVHGMMSFLKKRSVEVKKNSDSKNKTFIFYLKNEEELTQYCYYVAGTVGKLITRVFGVFLGNKKCVATLHQYCVNFGLGLQQVNIAKDFMVDKERGWCYIPTTILRSEKISFQTLSQQDKYTEVHRRLHYHFLQNARRHLKDGLMYTLALPFWCLRKRLFCMIPLFLALRTCAHIEKHPLNKPSQFKVSRFTVYQTLFISVLIVWSNFLIRFSCHRLFN